MLKQVGDYTLSERIARGALSRIYRAVDRQGRPVAIKVSTTQAEAEHLNDFQRDLVAAAGVLHPNLAAVHDLGFEDELPYLVMELVEGRDFGKLRKSSTPLLLSERVHAMLQVGDALKTAHERQVFHLDVRPSKIMLGSDGVSKLLGLGSGRLSYDPARVTDHGYLIGSPLYMSPERLNAIEIADGQCDIWSFGVTFYELIAGKHPFYDDGGERMIGNIMDNQPPPLAGVPASLNHVILRALEKNPAARYRNFAELLTETKPIVSELQREESDALMAQALEQTDSGRWHEARHIARQLREGETEEAPTSPVFDLSESELELDAPVAPETPAAAPAIVAASSGQAVELPKSASTAVQEPVLPRNAPRPERTASKIPMVRPKNGALEKGKSSPAVARASSIHTANSPRMAGTGVLEPRTGTALRPPPRRPRSRPLIEPAPGYQQPTPLSSERSILVQSPVRVLDFSESRGLPWGKMAGVAVVGLLAAGISFFYLRQPQRLIAASDDSKALSPASRVIKPSSSDPSAVSAFSLTNSDLPLTTASDPVAASPDGAHSEVTPPRPFDPKSLVLRRALMRRTPNSLASLAPPFLTGNVFVADSASLPPVVFNPPPPPTPQGQDASLAIPAATTTVPQTVQAAHALAAHMGSSLTAPVLVYSVPPVYPSTALQRKTQGIVRFEATITKDGSLKNLHLISGDPLLNLAAKQAVSQWKYRPATLNGAPVEVTQDIIVKFNLDR